MTIIESLVRLRDDLKKWVTNNLLFLDKRTRNIEDDGSGALNIIDEKGNLILRVDEDGVKTTAVEAKAIRVDGKDVSTLGSSMENIEDDGSDELTVTDPDGNTILRVDEEGLETTVVKAQRLVVNGVDVGEQEPPVTDYNDLENAPDIEDDESAELVVTDPDGNVVMRVDGEGIDAVGVKVNGVEVDPNNVQYTEQELTEEQKAQARANIGAVSADEVGTGDASMENIVDDESGELTVQDPNGNPILRVDEFGLETTRVVAGGVDLGAALAALDHDDVIYAIYGETTYAEVKAAADEGKVVLCLHGGRIYELATFYSVTYEGVTKYYAQFWAIPDSGQARYLAVEELDGESTWGHSGTYRGEGMHNKVKEITEESTDIQYPSAKAVYDLVQTAALTFETDDTLSLTDGVLKVNMATEVGDQTLPVTAAAVNTTVGNIETLLATI